MDKEEKRKLVTYSAIFILLALVILPIVGLLVISQLGPYIYLVGIFATDEGSGDEPRYSMNCFEGDEIHEIKEEWVRSDNITSYEDIPKNQTRDIPQRINESLKAAPSFWFTATEYENLSEREKEVFRRGLNGTRVNRNEAVDTLVLYQGDVYYCDTDRFRGGA